jgi:hypothetical protein
MKKETNEVIGTFIGQTITWVLFLFAIGLVAKIAYIIITFAWRLI